MASSYLLLHENLKDPIPSKTGKRSLYFYSRDCDRIFILRAPGSSAGYKPCHIEQAAGAPGLSRPSISHRINQMPSRYFFGRLMRTCAVGAGFSHHSLWRPAAGAMRDRKILMPCLSSHRPAWQPRLHRATVQDSGVSVRLAPPVPAPAYAGRTGR